MFEDKKQELCDITHMLFERNLASGTDGNISIRVGSDIMLITPSGVNKGLLKPEMVLVQKFDGTILEGTLRSSRECKLHIKIYSERDDINAVIHTHPAYSTAFAACGKSIPQNVLIEAPVLLGDVAVAPYGQPGTSDVVKSLDGLVENNDVILLQNHGVVVYSEDLIGAFNKMDSLENAAKSIIMARILGDIKYIPDIEILKIRNANKMKKK